MEQESRNRRRRSIRNLRRSSGFYTDSFTSAFEVEDQKADSQDDSLVSAYGSVWLNGDHLGKNTDSMATCLRETAKQDSLACNHCYEKHPDLPSSQPGCEFSESLFSTGDNLGKYQSLIGGSFGARYVSNVLGADLIDVTSLSLYDPGIDGALRLQSPKQSMEHLGVDMSCGEESCPEITHVPSAHISNSLRKNNADGAYLVQENLNLSHDDEVCVFKSKRLHNNVYHDKSIVLKENIQFGNEVVKAGFTDEVIGSVVTEKLPDSENVIKTSDDLTAVSLKDRRKYGINERPSAIKDSECKPKKRKRLSLKQIARDSTDAQFSDVNRHAQTNGEVKISIVVESENNISENLEMMNNTHNLNTYNINSASASEKVDTNKWSENLEINCVDHLISKEIDFEKDFFFQDFQTSTCEKRSKRSSQSKAKAARRSSRLFQPCEMPLNDLSLEQNPDLEVPFSRTSKDELYDFETSSSVSVNRSPEFSCIMSGFGEDKENIPALNVYATEQTEELEEADSSKYLHSTGTDSLLMKNSTLMERVVENFAHLCMNEKTETHSGICSEDLIQTRQRDNCTVPSDTANLTAANVYCCTDSGGNNGDILDMDPYVDTFGVCNNLLDSSTLQENVSSDKEMSFHTVKLAMDCEEQNSDNMEEQQLSLDTAFPTPSADFDMEELLSPDKKPAEQETDDSVISDSRKCMRLHRGRKSWDPNQLHADARKKPVRRKSKQGNPEEIDKFADSSSAEMSLSALVTEQPDNDSEQDTISPGLLNLYRNKNFVAPQPRSWETIKESPKSCQFLFTKQRQKCFLVFENGITRAKLQRRHKKALDIYKKIGGAPSAISNTVFEQKMLDIQLSIDS